MAQRRISGKRRSQGRRSANNSEFLDDNTNIIHNIDKDDQWYNLTSVRPSTSINLSKRASEELDPDSNVNASKLSDKWYEDLSRSNASILMNKAATKNQHEADSNSEELLNVDEITEPDSEKEFSKKRAGIRSKLNKNQSDSTNQFLKALEKEKTYDASRNLTSTTAHDIESSAAVTSKKTQKENKSVTENIANKSSNEIQNITIHKTPRKKRTKIRSKLNQNHNKSNNVFLNVLENTDMTNNLVPAAAQDEHNLSDKLINFETIRTNVTTRSTSRLTATFNKSQKQNKSVNQYTLNKTEDQNKSTNQNNLNKTQDKNKSINQNSLNKTEDQNKSTDQNNLNETQDQNKPAEKNTFNESSTVVEASNGTNNQSAIKSKSIKDSTNDLSLSYNSKDKQSDSEIQKTRVSTRSKTRLSTDLNETPSPNKSLNRTVNNSTHEVETEISSNILKNQSAKKSKTAETNNFNDVSSKGLTNLQMDIENENNDHNRTGSEVSTSFNKIRKRKKSITENIAVKSKNDTNNEISSTKNKSSKKAKFVQNNTNNDNQDISHQSSTNKEMYPESDRNTISPTKKSASVTPNKTQKQRKSVTETVNKSNDNVKDKTVHKSPRKQLFNKSLSSAIRSPAKHNNIQKQIVDKSLSKSHSIENLKKKKLNLLSKGKENTAADNVFDAALESDGAVSSYSKASGDASLNLHPLQSTLVPSGKPLSRLTIFQNSRQSLFGHLQDTPPASSHSSRTGAERPFRTSPAQAEKDNVDSADNAENEKQFDNVPPLISRRLIDIPDETEKSTNLDETRASIRSHMNKSTRSNRSIRSRNNENVSIIPDSEWEKVQKRIAEKKKILEEEEKREKEIELAEKRKKEKNQADLWRKIIQSRNEIKKRAKPKKPIDKAFLVNGKVYKQPKLPKPQKWVTERLYNHLWKCMEPKYKIRTRIKSEKFIRKFSDLVKIVIKKQDYKSYKSVIEEILVLMARYHIIKNRFEFYQFCRDFMTYDFRKKVLPMMLPGNKRNIPYDAHLVHEPILRDGSGSDSSDNEGGGKPERSYDESSESDED